MEDEIDKAIARRRAFLGAMGVIGLGGLMVPREVGAQAPARLRRIGVLLPTPWSRVSHLSDAFQRGLREAGWIEGQNIHVETRSSDGRDERFAAFAKELVAANMEVIVAVTVPAIQATQQATKTIPIVMVLSSDPVRMGLVPGLARPGGNTTGLASAIQTLAPKRVELLKETIPGVSRAALIWNPANPAMHTDWSLTEATARKLGIKVRPLELKAAGDLDSIFDAILRDRPEALIVVADPLTLLLRAQIVQFAARHGLPAVYGMREFVEAGGLMSYGTSVPDHFRRAGYYVDRLLKGTRPADLPVEQPAKFDMVINEKAAQALGLKLPQSVLLRADEVIR
jgi:putative ABC transport system substrate-binding protein